MIKKSIVFLVLGIVFLASSYSLLNDKMFRVHDYIHAARIVEMSNALADGQFPVRWSDNFGYGFGMPLYEFYAPLPFYFGALFYFIGFNINWSIKLLFLASNLFTLWGAYLLGKKLFGRMGGLLTATAMTLAPYRAVNLFVRGAISEAWGMMALPWILYSLILIVKDKKNSKSSWLMLIISLVVLALSHNLTTLMFFPLSFLFILVYLLFGKGISKTSLILLAKIFASYVLAVGVASFYMIPALAENEATQIGSILSGYFHYSHHFLYIRQFFKPNWLYGGSEWGPNDQISFFLGYGQLLAVGLIALYWLKDVLSLVISMVKDRKTSLISKLIKFVKSNFLGFWLLILIIISLFMSLLKSKYLWDTLPLLSYIQFPWRWLAPVTMLLAVMVGFVMAIKKSKLLFIVILLVLLQNASYFHPKEYLENSVDFYYTDELLIQRQMSDILPDYIPAQMDTKLIQSMSQDLELADILLNEGLEYDILVNRSHEKLVAVDLDSDTLLSFRVADYPGWKAEVDGQSTDIHVGELGNILVPVVAGQHKVGVYLAQSQVRMIADIVSLVSLVIMGLLFIDIKKKIK